MAVCVSFQVSLIHIIMVHVGLTLQMEQKQNHRLRKNRSVDI